MLESLAKASAILAGLLMTVITLMTCVSLIGRNTTGATLAGDFELTGVAAGAAIALFMPWCQLRRGNIIVDFFTAKASERTNAALDRLGALLLGLPSQDWPDEVSWEWLQAQLSLLWRPLFLGGLITAGLTAVVVYFGTNLLWRWSSARRLRRRRQRPRS